MRAADLEQRYGEMVSLDELATFFHAHIRAVRNALEAKSVPILTLGKSTVVPMRLVERNFGLDLTMTDDDALRRELARIRSSYHPDGRPKSVREYAAEVLVRAPEWVKLIDEARNETAPQADAAR